MKECTAQVLRICPEFLRPALEQELERQGADIEEIRLRVGYPVLILTGGGERVLKQKGQSVYATPQMVAETVISAANQSLYAAQAQLVRGFCTIPGGHRVGVCGEAVTGQERIVSMKAFSSVNIRIAREIYGAADRLANCLASNCESTLIAGIPGAGKTTLLRDLIRQLSDKFRQRVSVVDERGEIGACVDGVPQFHLGKRTDILTGVGKQEGIFMLLRSMNPQWIALDEISEAADVEAIEKASFCGVRLLATAHAWSVGDLRRRPIYRALLKTGVFRNLAVLDKDRRLTFERIAYELHENDRDAPAVFQCNGSGLISGGIGSSHTTAVGADKAVAGNDAL